ncbi:transcription termination factor MTERF2, chloroplastic-like [Nymphaea colorata]|nr:transcription termination factor MTERF2, chloroplastic-like [Nymphaea colorata]
MLIYVSASLCHVPRLSLLTPSIPDASSPSSSSSTTSSTTVVFPRPIIQKVPLFIRSKPKQDFDVIQDLLQSSPARARPPKPASPPSSTSPTTLEREALLVVGSPDFSLRQREETMNSLLDLLEHKGVTTAYAFEFIRHAGDVINELIVDARCSGKGDSDVGGCHSDDIVKDDGVASSIHADDEDGSVGKEMSSMNTGFSGEIVMDGNLARTTNVDEEAGDENKSVGSVLFERKPCFRQERSKGIVGNSPFATRVYKCAERRGLARLVLYFEVLSMKACHIPSILPLTGGRIDVVLARVEFLRSIGIGSSRIPMVLATWPQILRYECDSLASVVEYLKGFVGLSNKEFVRIIVKHPNILGHSVKEIDQNVNFIREIGLSSKEVKTFFIREPQLLIHDLKSKLGNLVGYFTSVGVQQQHIGRVLLQRPALLSSDLEKNVVPVVNYLKSLRASPDDIDKIVSSFPGVFFYDLEKDFKATVSQLENAGVKPSVMGKLFRKHPHLLKSRMNFGPKLKFLLELGLKNVDLGRVIFNAPQLLSLNIEEKILPTVKFLETIGVKGALLRKLLRLKPMVLAYSMETKLQPNIKFLHDLGIEHVRLGRLVARHPQLLTLSVEKNLEPTVRYLLNLGFTQYEVMEMVLRLPSLLGFSISDVLEPKYNYATLVMGRSPQELVRFPQFFSYSLEGRIVPRHVSLGNISCRYSLSTIYGCKDSDFNLKLSKWKTTSDC